jgi:hypothetical protein
MKDGQLGRGTRETLDPPVDVLRWIEAPDEFLSTLFNWSGDFILKKSL